MLLSLVSPEGWAMSFQMDATQLDELRSSLGSAATALATPRSMN
jgi:hypothetical protein